MAPPRLRAASLGLALLCLLAGCDMATEPLTEDSAVVAPPPETVRGCRSAVLGELSGRYVKSAVTVGSLTFGGELGVHRFAAGRELKVLVLIPAGEEAILALSDGEASRSSLLYDAGRGPRRPLRFSDGTSSVRFTACPDVETQFNGGFYSRGAHCARVQVWAGGDEQPLEGWLPLGAVAGPCPP